MHAGLSADNPVCHSTDRFYTAKMKDTTLRISALRSDTRTSFIFQERSKMYMEFRQASGEKSARRIAFADTLMDLTAFA